MFHVVLYQPEIPPNTGNIIRLCANSGAQLHLIKPLGFSPTDSKLKRAGLDYHDWASVHQHENFDAFKETVRPARLFAISTRGTRNYAEVSYQPDDALLFGPETRGLPQTVLDTLPKDHILRIPLRPHNRSLNLSNAVAVVLYEAWRQQGFAGAG
ncbi:MAG: tRNA (uridine(34)/cytosine(34)/5-carboxymethylaminomethyluridine(34)-2'-O)-methyltransferase TrmL [Gammaproteobacteria bacterium]|nr:tRNA (uridine(34)/cytosine(34)/5-carboxymethylaminomethyluridine(34)-2'-O)-methyltransferase TrmL [Gammaproteobacteria bacterium]